MIIKTLAALSDELDITIAFNLITSEGLGEVVRLHNTFLAVDADVCGGEPVFHDDKVIGVTTSGAYGHAVGKSLAFAYVDPEFAVPDSTFNIEILGQRRRAKV